MMTLCPIALTAGCEKCFLFSICPAKTIIGNYDPKKHEKDKTAQGAKKPNKE